MKLPNKIYSYSESTLSKLIPIIKILKQADNSVIDLYHKSKKHFENIEDYIDTLDCLYALNKITVTENEALHYVK